MEKDSKKRRNTDITKENSKDFVQDGMTTADIKKTIRCIREYIEKPGGASHDERVEKLKEDHAFFIDRYPMMFDMCSRQEFNYAHLDYFLKKRDEIIADKISAEDASKAVGMEWFNKFVDISKLDKK